MRRWQLLSRLWRDRRPYDRDRCILVVEQLEAREVLSPMVVAPFPVQTPEDVGYTFSVSGAFFVSENGSGNVGQNYIATLTASNGVLSVDGSAASSLNVSVANNGTAAVTLTGRVEDLTSLLIGPGLTFVPTSFFSGEAAVAVALTDPLSGESASDSTTVRVSPVASNAFVEFDTFDEVWAPASGFVFPPGFAAVFDYDDADGSELVTVFFQLQVPDPTGFTLSANGVPIVPDEPGQWRVSGTTPAALQATLDALVLTPPAGFSGRAFFSAFGDVRDEATFTNSPTTENDFAGLGFSGFIVRFFQGTSVTTPAVFGQEGGTIDLGGRFVGSDPDELPTDFHVLTLSVPTGTLAFDPARVPEGVTATGDGTTVTLSGELYLINEFLALAGSVVYTPGEQFSGVVPLTITLTNQPGEPFSEGGGEGGPIGGPGGGRGNLVTGAPNAFSGVVSISVVPLADRVFPSATDVTTPQDTPVVLSVALSALVDADGSESVLVLIEGVPAGATFNRGTDLGGGQWAFAPSDLPGLTFTPPPGATGSFALVVKVIVTDSAQNVPADSATEQTAFTVTVTPAPVVPADPVDDLPPDEDDESDETFESDDQTSADFDLDDADLDGDDDDDGDDVDRTPAKPELFAAYAGGSANDFVGQSTEVTAGYAPPTAGSFFAQVEAPLPSYGAGEKHPLPPVLPLDQTLPVAGFSESGGDSFALVDKLYRDAAATNPPGTTVTLAPQDAPSTGERAQVALALLGVDPAADAPVAADPAPAEAAPPGQWRVWAATAAVVGSLLTWAWLSRHQNNLITRAVRKLLRAPHRRPTERTV